jgi:GWxTD domain-containing protein
MRRKPLGVLILAALTAGVVSVPATIATAAAPQSDLQRWASGAVSLLMLPHEFELLEQISDPVQGRAFIEWFWARRNPEPSAPVNAFRREFLDRVAYVDKEFGDGSRTPGWATGRGRIYMLLGPPEVVLRTERRFFVDGSLRSLTMWQYRDQRTSGRVVGFAFVTTRSGTKLAVENGDHGLAPEQDEVLRLARERLVRDRSMGRFAIVDHRVQSLPLQAALTTNGDGVMARLSLPLEQLMGEPAGDRIRYRFRITALPTAAGTLPDSSDVLELGIGPDEFRTGSEQILHIAVWMPPGVRAIRLVEEPTGRTAEVAMLANAAGTAQAIGRKLAVSPLLGGAGVAVAYFPVYPGRQARAEAVLVDASDPGAIVIEPLPGGRMVLAMPRGEGR